MLARRVAGDAALEAATPESLRASLAPADHSDAASLYFWSAVDLGAWSRLAGLLAAVREGVATRLHEQTLRSIALDPSVEQAARSDCCRACIPSCHACRCFPVGSTTRARSRWPSERSVVRELQRSGCATSRMNRSSVASF